MSGFGPVVGWAAVRLRYGCGTGRYGAGEGGAERAEREGELGLFCWLRGWLATWSPFSLLLCLLSYTGLRLGDGFCERTVYLFLEGTGEPG